MYEIWCEIRQQKHKEGETTKDISDKKLYKYIGETSKSCFERGSEHLRDANSLKKGSHILKHIIEKLKKMILT